MPVIDKPLDSVEIPDLQELVDHSVQEGKEIEYKEFLNLSTDSNNHKEAFVGEVTSFANAQGGDLIVGLPDDDGKPKEVAGFPLENGIDQTLEQWASIIRRQTDPTLPAVAFDIEAIPTEDDRVVIIVRIERSWRAPHRVALNDRFYGRSPTGKVRLDTGELRRRFRESEQQHEQVRERRADRVSRIQAQETPVPLRDGPIVVFHVVPFTSFDLGTEIDIGQATISREGAPRLFGPEPKGQNERYTIEGIVTCMDDPPQEQPAYTLTFRSGVIEAAATSMFYPLSTSEYSYLDSSGLRKSLESTLPRFCGFLLRQDIFPPFAVFLTVIGGGEYTVQRRQESSGGRYVFNRDIAQLPAEIIEQVPDPNPEPIVSSSEPGVRPAVNEHYKSPINNLMDSVWQAVGQSGEPR